MGVKTKEKRVDEIRFNEVTDHYSWVFERRGDMRKSAGITHSAEFGGVKMIPLPDNPNPNDIDKTTGKIRQTYFYPKMQWQNRRTYKTEDRVKTLEWSMSKANKEKIMGHFGKGKGKNKKR